MNEYKTTIDIFQEALGGKWKLFILARLCAEPKRPSALCKLLPGISQRILTKELQELMADGLVERQIFAEVPPRVEYSLTAYGKTALPLLKIICEWGQAHLEHQLAKSAQPVIIANDIEPLATQEYVVKRTTRIDWNG